MKILLYGIVGAMGFMSCLEGQDHKEYVATPLRMVTYNIRRKGKEKKAPFMWENRRYVVAHILKMTRADIIGFQEATRDQIDDLIMLLPRTYKWVGAGRGESWWGWGKNEYTPIFYNSDRLTLLASGTFFINKLSRRWYPWHASQTGFLPRICTWAQFKDNLTDKKLYIFNTHLDQKYETARCANLHAIKNSIDAHHDIKNNLVFIMGDFNTENISTITDILPDFTVLSAKADHIFGPPYTRTGWDNKNQKNIDHIFVNALPVHVISYGAIEVETPFRASDHRPVYALIEL